MMRLRTFNCEKTITKNWEAKVLVIRMQKILKSNRGITLIELITVLVISTILIMASGMAISVFFRRYKEINAYMDLQKEAMKCLNVIKNGYPMREGEDFYGVANANEIEITGSSQAWNEGTGIKIIPPFSQTYQSGDMVHFYLDHGVIKVKYSYKGTQTSSAQYLFPTRDMQNTMEVTRFSVSNANAEGELLPLQLVRQDGLIILKIVLEARVLIKDAKLPRNRVYKTVSYSTYMVKK